jgi:hypothetical protein
LSGTPAHLPIALQPSTQSWRVICVRAGMARSSASESDSGVATSPSTASRQLTKSSTAWRAQSSLRGRVLPLVRKSGDMSASAYSRASAAPPSRRWMR